MLEDFRVFQLAIELHHRCKELDVPPYLRDQLLRASSSVAMNIAEGSGKMGEKDQRRFYSISLGSLREVQAVFALERINDPKLKVITDQIGAILFTLCRIQSSTKGGLKPLRPLKSKSPPNKGLVERKVKSDGRYRTDLMLTLS